MRRWRKILFICLCGILAVIVCAWLLRDALAPKPIMVQLPDGMTFYLYATTHGTNQAEFPDTNPLKRLRTLVRRLKPGTSRRVLSRSMMFDEKTAFWWFKVSPPLQLRGGSRPWLMTIDPATNNPFSLAICGPMQLGSQPEVVGCYLEDCPTNIPTFVINFVTQKTRIMAGESFIDKFITNITVPNPLYRR